ncbi:MAG: WecB/TagA/CpsF family glycosyltransferase [Candidatus Curtissbacteria bacterium]|nr:WecB/TagA/CpsF family glycosyltransferase [Candidatus Curtissbacteria bacterium]
MDLKRRKIDILGVRVDDISSEKTVDAIIKMAKGGKRGHYVVTVNTEFVMLAHRNREFMQILNDSDLAVSDGYWVAKSRLIFGGKEHDRVTGVDLIEKLCEKCSKNAVTIGFLGGFGSVAKTVAKRQREKNPGLKVVLEEPGDPAIGYDSRLKGQFSNIGRVDILFVAYGMGQQEFWIRRNKKSLNVGVFIGVGGALDYLAGVKKRAPLGVQQAGFEWLWRLATEPHRMWRMRVLPHFAVLILTKRLTRKFF